MPKHTESKDQSALQHDHPDLDVNWVDSIESTQQAVQPHSLLIAEHQMAGVGRRGNHWLTPSGKAICFSYRFNLSAQTDQMSGYALMVAVTIIQVMLATEKDVQAKVKWPNDLYFNDKKFGGILINLKPIKPSINEPNQLDITIGIGINWSLTQCQMQTVNQPVCNIPLNNKPTRPEFINNLVKQIQSNNPLFLKSGLDPFLDLWKRHDYLIDQPIRIHQDQTFEEGYYQGIDAKGQLLVVINGVMKHFSGGEVSVRTI